MRQETDKNSRTLTKEESMKNQPQAHYITWCDRPACQMGAGNFHAKDVQSCELNSGYAAKKEAKRLNALNGCDSFRAVKGACPAYVETLNQDRDRELTAQPPTTQTERK